MYEDFLYSVRQEEQQEQQDQNEYIRAKSR